MSDTDLVSVADAVAILRDAPARHQVCLGADGLWLLEGGQVQPSLDHILDLSSVPASSPYTNASLAMTVIKTWPDDASAFAVELVMDPDV